MSAHRYHRLGLVALSTGALALFGTATPLRALAEAVQPAPVAAAPAVQPEALAIAPVVAEPSPEAAPEAVVAEQLDGEATCLAKIVHHEAGNQPLKGQIAVAQVVMNRVEAPNFPKTICGVALQRGQFFNVHAYHPSKDARWQAAVKVALDVRAGRVAPVVGNAKFFFGYYANPAKVTCPRRITRLGDHIFCA